MIKGPTVDEHHLLPKSYGGKATTTMHRVCHTKIHSIFTEAELFGYYHTFERLKEHEAIQSFIRWIKGKPPEFNTSHVRSKLKKK